MPLDSNIPLQSRLNPNPVSLSEMMALGQSMRQRRQENEANRKKGTLQSMLQANIELGPEGPKLNKQGFLTGLARAGMPEEALQFQGEFQAQEDKRLEGLANRQRMISKRQGEIFKENEPYLKGISDSKERAKIIKDQFTREGLDASKIGDEITDDQLNAQLSKWIDPSFTPIQSGEFVKSFDRRTGSVSDPIVGGVPTKTPSVGQFKETEIELEDGRVVKANLNTKTGRYELAKLSGPNRIDGGKPGGDVIKAPTPGGENKREFDRLPKESQIEIEDYAKAKSAYTKSATTLESALKSGLAITDPREKVSHYLLTLKNVNSPTNPDAVGAEEVTRIAPELRRQFFNFTNPSAKFIGTDVEAFEKKLETFVSNLRNNAIGAQKEIDKLYGRKSGSSASSKVGTIKTFKTKNGDVTVKKISEGPDSDRATWGEQ